jgi:hypothetical protein
MTSVGAESNHYILFYFNIKEFFTVLRQRCSNPIQNDKAFQQKNLYAPEIVFTGPKTSWRDGCPANKGDNEVHQLPWEEDSPQYKNTF